MGLINTSSKEFRILATKNNDSQTLKNFITKFIPSGSNIITESWIGYNFLGQNEYASYQHIHTAGFLGREKNQLLILKGYGEF